MVVRATALCISQPPTYVNMARPQGECCVVDHTLVAVGSETWHGSGDDAIRGSITQTQLYADLVN